MNRGRILPWREADDAYLRENYATMSAEAIAFFLRRTMASVWKRASRLGLSRENDARFKHGNTIGFDYAFKKGSIPANKGSRTKLRIWERAAALFDEHKELTQTDMARLLGVPSSSVSGSLVQRPKGLMHIDRWTLIGKHYHAIYAAGPGDDAEKPNKSAQLDAIHADMTRQSATPNPIPAPVHFLWGICIATNDTRRSA